MVIYRLMRRNLCTGKGSLAGALSRPDLISVDVKAVFENPGSIISCRTSQGLDLLQGFLMR